VITARTAGGSSAADRAGLRWDDGCVPVSNAWKYMPGCLYVAAGEVLWPSEPDAGAARGHAHVLRWFHWHRVGAAVRRGAGVDGHHARGRPGRVHGLVRAADCSFRWRVWPRNHDAFSW